jgi:hypothetical protein
MPTLLLYFLFMHFLLSLASIIFLLFRHTFFRGLDEHALTLTLPLERCGWNQSTRVL